MVSVSTCVYAALVVGRVYNVYEKQRLMAKIEETIAAIEDQKSKNGEENDTLKAVKFDKNGRKKSEGGLKRYE